ncbi:MAG: adenylate kinase [Gammaproteobacteria bacterium]
MRIVLLGAPGSGKGTQSQKLQAKYGVPQISSGDLLRDAVARGTELGLKAKAAMDAGQLVSDEIVLGLIRDRLSRSDAANGFILDGFPRNIEQARALENLLREIGQPLDAVLLLDVRRETLVKRLAGRRVCPKCGTVYNVHSMPAGTTTCAKDGTQLEQRPDDKEDVIAKRLEVYAEQTQPLVEHYSRLGLLRVVAGEGELDEVFERMEAAALAKPVPEGAITVRRARTGSKGASTKRARATAKKAVRQTVGKAVAKKKTAAKKTAGKKTSGKKTIAKKKAVGAQKTRKKSAPKKAVKTKKSPAGHAKRAAAAKRTAARRASSRSRVAPARRSAGVARSKAKTAKSSTKARTKQARAKK